MLFFRRGSAEATQAGFPFFQLDRFLKVLVQELNESVAISEEFANTTSGKVRSGGLLFNRKITRVVTPGTLIDEKFINPFENNFLLAISHASQEAFDLAQEAPAEPSTSTIHPSFPSDKVGLAWLDLSTGDFYTQAITRALLPAAIARIGAREIVLDSATSEATEQALLGVPGHDRHLVTRHRVEKVDLSMSHWTSMLESAISPKVEESFTVREVAAGNILLEYVRERLQGSGMKLQPPIRKQDKESMSIDRISLRGLEILETYKDGIPGGKGSLLHTVRRTVTKGGTRMLKDWIGKSIFLLLSLGFYLKLWEPKWVVAAVVLKHHDDLPSLLKRA